MKPGVTGPLDIARTTLQRERSRLRAEACDLERPVLCAPGYRAAPAMSKSVRSEVLALTGAAGEMVEACWFPRAGRMMEAALVIARAGRGLAERFGSAEIDVVGVSMGGLAARLASTTWFEERTGEGIRIGRLFTLATPHRGALLADYVRLDEAARDMRTGSGFLRWLNEEAEERVDRMVCYARTRDAWVGMENTAPPGWSLAEGDEEGAEGERPRLLWKRAPLWTLSHLLVSRDPAILADIALRLRGERPLAWAHPDERGWAGESVGELLGARAE